MSETSSSSQTASALDPELLKLLACPRCADRPVLQFSASGETLECSQCGRIYPILEGIPDLRLNEDEIAAIRDAEEKASN